MITHMSLTKKPKLHNILFQVPSPLKKQIESRIFEAGFVSQSDYLKYLIRKDLDDQQKQIEIHDYLIRNIQEIAKKTNPKKIPPLADQLADL